MDAIKDIFAKIPTEVISAVIAAVGVVLSSYIAKRTASKTAKITAKAEMERLIAEQVYSDKVRREERTREKEDAAAAAFEKLSDAVMKYAEMPNKETKAAAVAACSSLLLSAGSSGDTVKKLSETLRHSDAFVGVDSDTVAVLLEQIASGR